MAKLKSHLFICTNGVDKTGRCGNKNSEQLRRSLKERCSGESWATDVRINSSGCLGHCENGIAAVMYPQGEWFFDLKDTNSELLFKVVEREAKTAAEKSK